MRSEIEYSSKSSSHGIKSLFLLRNVDMRYFDILSVLFACLSTLPPTYGSPLLTALEEWESIQPREHEPPVGGYNFRNCGKRSVIVMAALEDVQTLAKAAVAYGTSDYYHAWFGTQSGTPSDKAIKSMYSSTNYGDQASQVRNVDLSLQTATTALQIGSILQQNRSSSIATPRTLGAQGRRCQ